MEGIKKYQGSARVTVNWQEVAQLGGPRLLWLSIHQSPSSEGDEMEVGDPKFKGYWV